VHKTRKDICTLILLALALLAAPALRADVTIRYQSEMQPSAALQPIVGQLTKSIQTNFDQSIQMKGNKAYTKAGNWIQIIDFAKQEITLVDPAHKTFATLPASQLADRMAGAVTQSTAGQSQAFQQAMGSIKSTVTSKITGKTEEIQGVQAEEREVTVNMEIPMPAEMNQPGAAARLVMHIWTAKQAEALRVPAIRELTGYQAWQKYVMNPVAILNNVLGKMPGMANSIAPMLEELTKNPSVILRMRIEVFTPFLATLAKQMAIDPDAPLLQMNQEVAELSSAPVDASIFELPKDYTSVSADDLIRESLKAQTAAAAPAAK
jgi:hypothetical protein